MAFRTFLTEMREAVGREEDFGFLSGQLLPELLLGYLVNAVKQAFPLL